MDFLNANAIASCFDVVTKTRQFGYQMSVEFSFVFTYETLHKNFVFDGFYFYLLATVLCTGYCHQIKNNYLSYQPSLQDYRFRQFLRIYCIEKRN